MSLYRVLLYTLLVCCSILTTIHNVSSAIIGVDYGSEYIKVVSVAPGSGFHIVLDEQTKRKWPALVGFDTEERLFGNNAVNLAVKKPTSSYMYISRLLGHTLDSPIVDEFKQYGFDYKFVNITERNSIGIKHVNNDGSTDIYSIEEIVAMQLEHVIALAQADAGHGQVVRDAVISVPDYYTHKQRVALINAAEIANINILSLVNENTAAAVQFGIERKYDTDKNNTYIVIYNMGSCSTKVSLCEYTQYVVPSGRMKGKQAGQVEVISISYDENLGGHNFQNVITQWLIQKITHDLQHKYNDNTDISNNIRVIAKLNSAAEKAKTILSANTETQIYLTSLINDLDFSYILTRDEFYNLANDLLQRVTKPIENVISDSNIDINAIDQFVIIGGSVRIPGIQQQIKSYINRDTLSQSLNGDESIAFGNSFIAANLSASFQVKPFGLIDKLLYPVGVRINSIDDSSDNKYHKRATLYKHYNVLNKLKTIQFNYTGDLLVTLFNDNADLLPTDQTSQLTANYVNGIADLYNNKKYKHLFELGIDGNTTHIQTPQITLYFELDSSSVVTLNKAEAQLSELVETCRNKKVKNNKTKTDNDSNTADNNEQTSDSSTNTDNSNDNDNTDTTSTNTTDNNNNDDDVTVERICTKRLKHHTIPLRITTTGSSNSIQPMTNQQIAESQTKLYKLTVKDHEKHELSNSRNTLESYIYTSRSKLYDDNIEAVTTDEQRNSIRDILELAEDWLYSKDNTNTVAHYKNKLNELKQIIQPIELRANELVNRPNAINEAHVYIEKAHTILDDIIKNKPYINQTQYQPLQTAIETTEHWLSDMIEQQEQLNNIDNPVLLSSDIHTKLQSIKTQVNVLQRIKKPKPPKTMDINELLKKYNISNANVTDNDELLRKLNATLKDMKLDDLNGQNNYTNTADDNSSTTDNTSSASGDSSTTDDQHDEL